MSKAKCPTCKSTDIRVTKYKSGTMQYFGKRMRMNTNSSELNCRKCDRTWRTDAKYVDELIKKAHTYQRKAKVVKEDDMPDMW